MQGPLAEQFSLSQVKWYMCYVQFMVYFVLFEGEHQAIAALRLLVTVFSSGFQ